ncbi:helix-turn-helix domain-containing protein [Methanocaldococcus jannaschii]|uniref:helix-turn-helix domain-containing protein n=1 Tax=Methanocaldococcus jannaschii TaxID=2190 RepID=UPI000A01C1A4
MNYLTDKERNEIIKLYNEGYNINQIRKRIGRDFNTVKRCLQKEGIIKVPH